MGGGPWISPGLPPAFYPSVPKERSLFMGKYILKRVGYMFLTLFVVVTITFFLMRAIPGDPLATMARALPEQTRQAFYARYGLDRPCLSST